MVVYQIHVESVAALEAKDHAPVGTHYHAPRTFQIALQWMEPKTREIHVARPAGSVQNGKNIPQLFNLISTHSLSLVVGKQSLQSLMPEGLNHTAIITWIGDES